MNTLLTKNILNDELFKDITDLTNRDKRLHPDLVVFNYLYFTSFFSSKKIQLQIGDSNPTNSNLYSFVVGNSGMGKSYTNKLFSEPLFDIQTRLTGEHIEQRKFVDSCIKNEKDNLPFQENDRDKFLKEYNLENGTTFEKITLKVQKEHNFFITDFTPEKLSISFNESKNGSVLWNADEFETVQNNIGRTSTVSNTNTFLTSYFEGKNDNITRKNSESIIIKNGFICLNTNTTIDTFNNLKKSKFFPSGLGYRFLFFVQSDFVEKELLKINKSNNKKSVFKEYQTKVGNIFEKFFFDKVYNNDNEPLIITINTDENLDYYHECKINLCIKHIDKNRNLTNEQKSIIKSRIDTMFQKCILNTYLMNYSYSGLSEDLLNIELSIEDIKKGFYTYDYFLTNLTDIFDSGKTDLTEEQQNVINEIPLGGEMLVSELSKLTVKKLKIMSESSFYRLMDKKDSNQFIVTDEFDYDLKKKVKKIRRYSV